MGLDAIGDFNPFDEQITAPLHGFAGAFDDDERCSCRRFLGKIQKPAVWIIQAQDDPLLFPASLPMAHELGRGVTLELAAHGGHVGFVAGAVPGRPVYRLATRIMEVLGGWLGVP